MSNFSLVSQKVQNSVSTFYLNLSDILNSTGLYNFLKENDLYQKTKHELSNFLVSSVERSFNERFHNSLNIFEKIGFLSDTKWQAHQRKVGLTKGLTAFTTTTILDLAPALYDYIYQEKKFDNIIEFLIGWMAYINQQNSVIIQKRVSQFFRAHKREFPISRFQELFQRYSTLKSISFPDLSFDNQDVKYQLFHLILSSSDLQDLKILARAKECGNYLDIPTTQVDEILKNVFENQTIISDIIKFSGFSIPSLFEDLSQNIQHARECGVYSFENDPFAIERQKNMEIISEAKKFTPLILGGLSFFTGEIGDFLLISATPIINRLINDEIDIDKAVEISKRLKGFGEKL